MLCCMDPSYATAEVWCYFEQDQWLNNANFEKKEALEALAIWAVSVAPGKLCPG